MNHVAHSYRCQHPRITWSIFYDKGSCLDCKARIYAKPEDYRESHGPGERDIGVACKYTKGRCLRRRCNTVLCCEAEESLSPATTDSQRKP